MPNDRDFLDSQGLQQLPGSSGQSVEAVMNVGLGRFAKPDLVRDNNPIAVSCIYQTPSKGEDTQPLFEVPEVDLVSAAYSHNRKVLTPVSDDV